MRDNKVKKLKWIIDIKGFAQRTEGNEFFLFNRDYESKYEPWVLIWTSFFGGKQEMRFCTIGEAKEFVKQQWR